MMGSTIENELSFSLPPDEVKRVLLKSALFISIILITFSFLRKSQIDLSLVLILAIGHMAAYLLFIRHKYFFISPDYFRGESAFGRNVIIGWNEDFKISEARLNGLAGYKLRNKNIINFIFLPKAIATSDEFESAVAKFAPENHILLSLKPA